MVQTTLVTGASSGIGRDLAEQFARHGYNVILVARSTNKLIQLAADLSARYAITATPLSADLTDLNAPQMVYDKIKADGLTIDVLVNNAGFASYGQFYQLDTMSELQMIQVNVLALTSQVRGTI